MRTVIGRRRSVQFLAGLAVFGVTVAGCSIGDIRRKPPANRTATGSPSAEPDAVAARWQVRVPVPGGHELRQIEFVDAERGYALFVRPQAPSPTPGGPDGSAPGGETAVVVATTDGGRSWRPVPHPRPRATQHQLYAGNGLLVLHTEPGGYHVSADGGATFTHHPGETPPAAYHRTQGRFGLCCDDAEPQLVEWHGDRARTLPEQPPLPSLHAVAYGGGRLVAAGLRAGRAYVSISDDGGRSWLPAHSPHADGELAIVGLRVAADGDAWLLAHDGEPTRFPWLWRAIPAGPVPSWEPYRVADPPPRFVSAVALGAGVLVVTTPNRVGLIRDGRLRELPWPVRGQYLAALADGTLFARDGAGGRIWLGRGQGTDRRWVVIDLEWR